MSGSTTFNYTGSIVTYTVPATGVYDIVAYGAQGGASDSGSGAEIGGDFQLKAGQMLQIAVGGQGGSAQTGTSGGGGGGGTFVVLLPSVAGGQPTPLVIAGGGGGGPYGGSGQAGTAGHAGYGGSGAGAGGMNGNGGGAGLGGGGGGGGFAGSGGGSFAGQGGGGYPGLAGGAGYYSGSSDAPGGFGSGGGGGFLAGGGGGGYSGGGGGRGGFFQGGGGGGSFDGSILSNADLVRIAGESGGYGSVVITPVAAPAPTITPAIPSVVEENQTTVIGTVAPGAAGDSLSVSRTATGPGTLSLGAAQSDGTQQVIYTAAASISASTIDAVSYQVTDQQDSESATGSANVQLDAGPTVTEAAGSTVGNGQSTEIATVTPGLTGDTLTLSQTSTPANGTVSLQDVNGVEQVIYTAPGNLNSSSTEKVTYSITDQHGDAVANGTAFVGGNANQSVTATGDTAVILGNGNDMVTLGGTANAVLLGTGNDAVNGGTKDTIQLTGNGNLTVSGSAQMVFLGSGNDIVTDTGQGMALNIGPTAGNDVLANFGADLTNGVINLLGGIGGFTNTTAVLSALKSDGHGGSLLPLGHAASLDITSVAPSQLGVSNFKIG